MAALQGFSVEWFDGMKGISDREFRGMIGNSMSVPVLLFLIPRVLVAGGFATEDEAQQMLSLSGWG